MPRTARLLLPNTPHHVVQRGHNRSTVFARAEAFQRYLDSLAELKDSFGVKIYAWCLMTNHVHLIVEPGAEVMLLGQLMRRLAGRQTRFVNASVGRTGTLWEGRYKASPIQTDRYLLACSRYVELNPVRAGIVTHPSRYPWSSYRVKTGSDVVSWHDEDPCFEALGHCRDVRSRRYAAFVSEGVREDERTVISKAVRRNQLTGDGAFVEWVARRYGLRIEPRGPGRPRADR